MARRKPAHFISLILTAIVAFVLLTSENLYARDLSFSSAAGVSKSDADLGIQSSVSSASSVSIKASIDPLDDQPGESPDSGSDGGNASEEGASDSGLEEIASLEYRFDFLDSLKQKYTVSQERITSVILDIFLRPPQIATPRA